MSTPQYFAQPPGQPVQQQQPVQFVNQPTGAPIVQAPPLQGGVAYNAGQQVVYLAAPGFNQPNYTYKPNDFWVLSIVTTVLCGMFSPIFLVLTLPALYFSQRSKEHAKAGSIDEARKAGMISGYLNFAAVVGAFVVACLVTGLVLGLYGPEYSRIRYCNDRGYSSSYRCNSYY